MIFSRSVSVSSFLLHFFVPSFFRDKKAHSLSPKLSPPGHAHDGAAGHAQEAQVAAVVRRGELEEDDGVVAVLVVVAVAVGSSSPSSGVATTFSSFLSASSHLHAKHLLPRRDARQPRRQLPQPRDGGGSWEPYRSLRFRRRGFFSRSPFCCCCFSGRRRRRRKRRLRLLREDDPELEHARGHRGHYPRRGRRKGRRRRASSPEGGGAAASGSYPPRRLERPPRVGPLPEPDPRPVERRNRRAEPRDDVRAGASRRRMRHREGVAAEAQRREGREENLLCRRRRSLSVSHSSASFVSSSFSSSFFSFGDEEAFQLCPRGEAALCEPELPQRREGRRRGEGEGEEEEAGDEEEERE